MKAEKPTKNAELIMPRFMEEQLDYFDEETGTWKIKDDAPNWAKKEFEEFNKKLNPVPNENGLIIQP